MNRTQRKILEDKMEQVAESICNEFGAAVRSNLAEAFDMMNKSGDDSSKMTATIDMKADGIKGELRVMVGMKVEAKLISKSEPFGFYVALDGQGELPLDAEFSDSASGSEAKLLNAAPPQLPAPGEVEEAEVAEGDGDGEEDGKEA